MQTSFAQLFRNQEVEQFIERIEIPLIQRDYAQGRKGDKVGRIRDGFIRALYSAVMPGGAPINLDFIYGDVVDRTLYPLDGQQRLTTLFLLHWYLAWRACVATQDEPWTKFAYATRPDARIFCESLTREENRPPTGEPCLSRWLKDQAWYFYTWQNDPTIQSMLVVLDDLHECFRGMSDNDCTAAWQRLNDPQQPAISFHLLPIPADEPNDALYIKMNSRGRLLTPFETFKAHFEELLKTAHPKAAKAFSEKVDTEWSNTLWEHRGEDNLIDGEFMRYFRFVTEVCAWRNGVDFDDSTRIEELAEKVYVKSNNMKAADCLQFLFEAFDTWYQRNIRGDFKNLFTVTPGRSSTPLILFNGFENVPRGENPADLFGACCRLYGESKWTFAHTLLLYAVLLHRIHNTPNFPKQLRILRNLIEASRKGEIRDDKMPGLLADVEIIVVNHTLQEVTAFNQAQVANEREKAWLLERQPSLQPALYQLEDHRLLRGCLTAFDLDPSIDPNLFWRRVDSFHALFDKSNWPELTGALLAIDDYSRTQSQRFSDFGAPGLEEPWRDLLGGTRDSRLANALMTLLDRFAAANHDLDCLQLIQRDFIDGAEMNWRYYFVKYRAMREGDSGRYVGIVGRPGGYDVCMLRVSRMSGYYRDPYLLAILRESGVGEAIVDPWFTSYESKPRLMELKNSGICIRCVDEGWQMSRTPTDPARQTAFQEVCVKHGISQDGLYTIPQKDHIDTKDRVELGAKLLRDLVNAGL